MRRLPPAPRAALLAAACCLALSAIPATALAAPEPEPPDQPAPTALCPDGSLCSWPERDYGGEVTEISDGTSGKCLNLPRPARSAVNDSVYTAVFYASAGCVGGVVVGVVPGRKAPAFADAASVRLRQPGAATPAPATPAPAKPGTAKPGTAKPAPAEEGTTGEQSTQPAP